MRFKITFVVFLAFTLIGCQDELRRGVEVTKVTITDLNMGWNDDTILEGNPDPFIRIMINGSAIGETDYYMGQSAPVEYETQIRLDHDQANATIVFEIYDYDNVGDNDFMGSVSWDPDYQNDVDSEIVVGESNTIQLDYYWYEE